LKVGSIHCKEIITKGEIYGDALLESIINMYNEPKNTIGG
jgi:hypothetical protein